MQPDSSPLDPTERMSADDMAAWRTAEMLALALAEQSRRAAAPLPAPGTCANCGEACLPRARYCDEDCRADHEHRQAVLARQGRA